MIQNIKKTPEESFQIVSRMLFFIVQLLNFRKKKLIPGILPLSAIFIYSIKMFWRNTCGKNKKLYEIS